jgi:hypothetical protein
MRQSKDDVCRLLVPIYDAAYEPGGAKNPILVASDPPLTQHMVDLDTGMLELLLDICLTDRQRQEYQRLLLEDWKKWDQDERGRRTRNLEGWTQLATWDNYTRTEKRALVQPRLLTRLRLRPTRFIPKSS